MKINGSLNHRVIQRATASQDPSDEQLKKIIAANTTAEYVLTKPGEPEPSGTEEKLSANLRAAMGSEKFQSRYNLMDEIGKSLREQRGY